MASAIEQSAAEKHVYLSKTRIAALAADIVSTWRQCRRTIQRHNECDKIVGRMWPGRCVQDVALAIGDKARHEAFMDTLVIVDTEFSIMASAMATNPPVPKRLKKRPAASAAPASPGAEEAPAIENESAAEASPPSKKGSALAAQRARIVSGVLKDTNFMPGAPQKERFSAAQKMLSAASAAHGSSDYLQRAPSNSVLALQRWHDMSASAAEPGSKFGCAKCRWKHTGCGKCRG